MRGSIIANYIDSEYRRRKFYENKKRQKCIVDEKRQCEKCKYLNICEDKDEYEDVCEVVASSNDFINEVVQAYLKQNIEENYIDAMEKSYECKSKH